MGARIDKPVLLKRLFATACGHAAEEVSYTKILGQLQDAKNTVTLASYQELLAKAWLAVGLSKWAGNAVRRRGSSPKWLPLNNAFLVAHSDDPPKVVRSRLEIWGRWVENAVGVRLYGQAEALGGNLYWWRRGQEEVDFVVKAGGKLLAVEVKSGRSRGGHRGLEAFKSEWPSSRGLLVGSTGVPLSEFFETPLSEWLKAG